MAKIKMTWEQAIQESFENLCKIAKIAEETYSLKNEAKLAQANTAYKNIVEESISGVACYYVKYVG